MTGLTDILQDGGGNIWLFTSSAVMLGALHGLEPGHSKTMMAAFIIAVRGTVKQAILLGLAATVSHTLIVWIVALAGSYIGARDSGAVSEPYFQIGSAALMVGLGLWMILRVWRNVRPVRHSHNQHHHDHSGHDHQREHTHAHTTDKGDAVLTGIAGETRDAHELAHAHDIEKRFANRAVTTGQIVMFGLAGGLIPCPAAITVLLLCLQLKRVALGALLVLCFSIGLAVTMVTAGVAAALASRAAAKQFSGFGRFARYAPGLSGMLVIGVGVYMGWQGIASL